MVSMLCKQPSRPDDPDNPARTVLSAGCPVEYWDYFQKRFNVKIVEWFGMVDAPGYLLNDEGRIGSMGKPAGDVLFKVVDGNDAELPPGKVGELVLHHPLGRMSEYHNLPDATESAYRDGWFHTGDLAEIDSDGYFYYRGRKKESMRRRGENISAWEIESVLNGHPAIAECAAHAVPSDLGEDEVKVVAVLKQGERLDPLDLLRYCEGKMAYYAIPRYIEYVDEIEKTPTQRIRYAELKERGITGSTWDREKAGYRVRKDA
jgi:crotonobetaine/carnitine-CoA ligase